AEYVVARTEDDSLGARVPYHVHSHFDVRRAYSVPTDGDNEDIPEYLQTEQAWTLRDWLDLLGSPPITAYLALATVAAKYDLTEGHTRLNSEVGIRVTELSDQVAAFQMPTIERLERISAQ